MSPKLAGIDAAFLYLETPSAHMHVLATLVLDPAAPDGRRPGAIGAAIATRLARVPRFRQRLVETPLGLDHPRLSDDPAFHLDQHVFRRTLPPPASERALADAVAEIGARPLARDRALWELWEIDGLAGDQVAVVLKVHHAAIDGVGGMDLLAQIFDLAPNAPAPPPLAEQRARALPSSLAFVPRALSTMLTWPMSFARALGDSAGAAFRVLDRALAAAPGRPSPTLPFDAPRTVLNHAISGERAAAFARIPLADVKALRHRLGATVNDVVLMLCTMSLRGFLAEHGGVPDRALVASVPVAIGDAGPAAAFNHVSALFVGLPVHLDDPQAQLRFITSHAEQAKSLHAAAGGQLLSEWAELAPPALFAQASQLFSRWQLAERMTPVHNLVVSNVAGPQIPLYAGGARVVGLYPLGPVLEGAALNLTVISYDGTVHVGVITCRRAVPDPWPIAEGCAAAAAELIRRSAEADDPAVLV